MASFLLHMHLDVGQFLQRQRAKALLPADMSQRHSGISLALKMEVYCCGDMNIDSPIPQSGKHSD